jgi:hypothetical protein
VAVVALCRVDHSMGMDNTCWPVRARSHLQCVASGLDKFAGAARQVSFVPKVIDCVVPPHLVLALAKLLPTILI